MYLGDVEAHRINSKMQLVKTVREQYTHSGLPIFPANFKFRKTVLIVEGDIIERYWALLLTEHYDFVVCASTLAALPDGTQGALERLGCTFALFDDRACTETAGLGLGTVLRYARERHPEAAFDIVGTGNLADHLAPFPEAMDILLSDRPAEDSDSPPIFKKHYHSLEYHHRCGKIAKGVLIVSAVYRNTGEVLGTNSRTRVTGSKINRGMHGDEVYTENDEVVGIHRRKLRMIVGTLYKLEDGCGYVRPIDCRLPDLFVYTQLRAEYVGRKVYTSFIEWRETSPLPRAVIFSVLGENAEMEDELRAVMTHFDIKYADDAWIDVLNRRREEAGEPVHLGAAPSLSSAGPDRRTPANDQIYKKCKIREGFCERTPEGLGFSPDEFSVDVACREVQEGRREDLRHLDVCSIDPVGCTDIDDALHCIRHGDHIEVGVHIADVSLYVKEGSVLDLEAKHRSTTVYFPDRRIDMLPAFLSANLCSLVEGSDRASFSCIWRLDPGYNVVDTRICRSVIRSRGAFSYEEAHEAIKNDNLAEMPGNRMRCVEGIRLLMKIASKLRKDRFDSGALELSTQEVYVDAQKNIRMKDSVPTHHLVEEFMLLANISVARFIHRHNPEYSLLRKHPLPSAIDLEFVDCSSSKAINASLARVAPENLTIVKRIITRSMQQALYFPSGESPDFYHYGLATEIYTHFTSPIRRYPDIIIHRTLSYILSGDEDAIDALAASVTSRTCSFMNYRHRNAQNASRMVSALYLYVSLEERPMDAIVVSVREGGCVVFIREYGIEEFLPTDILFRVFDPIKVSFKKDVARYCITRRMDLFLVE